MTTILVVEDNQDIQALLAEVLQTDYQVLQADDGASGLQQFQHGSVDLVILDLMLPGITGESVLKTIRKKSSVPILVLTAIQDKQKIVELLNAGANDYLTKPFDLDELLARVTVQLRQTTKPKDKLQVGAVCLDIHTREAKVNDHVLNLTKKEFALLKMLMSHPHQVFEKATLYEQVWQEPYFDAENTFNVHLSKLRHKLEQWLPQDQHYLVTVWGIGVRFQ